MAALTGNSYSFEQSEPKMVVSGGTWTQVLTVKNSVARAPEITPTTDEITATKALLHFRPIPITAC